MNAFKHMLATTLFLVSTVCLVNAQQGCKCAGDKAKSACKMPKVIAHRGYWKTAGSAQNSITSLTKAASAGCFGSEADIWLTGDNVLVVNHDKVFKGCDVEEAAAAEATAVVLDNGETLPTLEAYMRKLQELPGIRFILEVKTLSDASRVPLEASLISDMLEKYGLVGRTDIIAFSKAVCEEFVKQMPGTKVFYLNGDLPPKQLKELGFAGPDYNRSVLRKNPDWVRESHELGMEVNVWTVNKKEDMEYFIDLGVDYITTDEPELLQSVIKEKTGR